jgi:hypothetical protein
MGRYCDVYGQQVKLTGLLREVVLDLAADAKHHHDLGFDGVYVEYDDDVAYLAEGPVVLHRQDVEEVVAGMRREILGGCASWSPAGRTRSAVTSRILRWEVLQWRKSRSIQTVHAAATPGQVLVSRPNQTGGSLSSSPLAQCADDPRLRPYVKAWS